MHSGAGASGYAASDRIPEQIGAVVYVDSGPATGALEPDFEGDEKPLPWEQLAAEENLDGLSEDQLETFRQRAVPEPGGVLRDAPKLTNDARLDVPTTAICTGYTSEQYKDAVKEGYTWLGGFGELRDIHVGGPAHQPLADVVASEGARGHHRRRLRRPCDWSQAPA